MTPLYCQFDALRAQLDRTERPQPAVSLPRKVAVALGLLVGAGGADDAPAALDFVRAMCPAQCYSCAACTVSAAPTASASASARTGGSGKCSR